MPLPPHSIYLLCSAAYLLPRHFLGYKIGTITEPALYVVVESMTKKKKKTTTTTTQNCSGQFTAPGTEQTPLLPVCHVGTVVRGAGILLFRQRSFLGWAQRATFSHDPDLPVV